MAAVPAPLNERLSAAVTGRSSHRKLSRAVLLFLSVSLCWLGHALAMWWLDRWAIRVSTDAYASAWGALATSLVAFSAWLVLASLTRRIWVSLLLLSAMQVALYAAASMKLELLRTPLSLSDLHFIASISPESIDLFGTYLGLPGGPWPWLVGLSASLLLAFWLEPAAIPRMGALRWAMLLVGTALLASLWMARWPWTDIYTQERLRPSRYGPMPAILHGGHVGAFVFDHLMAGKVIPPVDETSLRNSMAMLGLPPVPPSGMAEAHPKPDIVMILSESFMDPRIIQGMEALPDPIPAVRKAIARGDGGWMKVPAYGGGTVRTEFEALTGMPVAAFPEVNYPYVELRRKNMPGLASVLRHQGYWTLGIHGNVGSFWNRTNTYQAMGFDRFLANRAFKEKASRDGAWFSDASMTDFIIEALDADDAPGFIMAVSIQNHGPYHRDVPVADESLRASLALPQAPSGEEAFALRNYLYHLHQADRQFERLHDYLETRGRPYVLVFFGDHLPALGWFDDHPFVDGKPATSQAVPWVMVSNLPGQDISPAGVMPSWELPAITLQRAGISDPYFGFIQALATQLATLPPDASSRDELSAGLHAAAVARLRGRFEDYLP